MDEEESQKRFTDCVYFLASPLTCKKGIECCYRHNEIARLNPRDCWYWLRGCCYNPDCAFRHPPVEGLKEAYYESLNPGDGAVVPVNKTNIPCYFYSKGFCNKADRCAFLHEPSVRNKSMVENGVPCENKLSAENNTGSTPVQIAYTHPDPPNTAQPEYTNTVMKHTPHSRQSASRNESVKSEENVEPEEFVQSEENVVQNEEIVVQNETDAYNDQSSDGYVEQEQWLDLSPGFDILVEGESERLEYEENDVDFFPVNDDEHRELNFLYPEYDHFDKIPGQSRVSIFNRLSFKRRNIHKELIFNVQRTPDLRDHLKKSKVVDFDRLSFKKRNIHEELIFNVQRGLDLRDHLMESKVVDSDHQRNFRPHGSLGVVDFDHRGWLRKADPVNRYRPLYKKPRFLSSEVSRSRKPSREESAVFTGPKTLDQIKEEKKISRENRDSWLNNRTGSDGIFQGPRPLSEILKNKRKLG